LNKVFWLYSVTSPFTLYPSLHYPIIVPSVAGCAGEWGPPVLYNCRVQRHEKRTLFPSPPRSALYKIHNLRLNVHW